MATRPLFPQDGGEKLFQFRVLRAFCQLRQRLHQLVFCAIHIAKVPEKLAQKEKGYDFTLVLKPIHPTKMVELICDL
jgi:hypothetical protein